jgi:hypothetical protein
VVGAEGDGGYVDIAGRGSIENIRHLYIVSRGWVSKMAITASSGAIV